MRPSERLSRIPPYLFAELERKIAEKRAAGIDVISLGIGDPDTPTPARSSRRCSAAVADPRPTSTRPTAAAQSSARRSATSTRAASAYSSTPRREVMPAIGAKECIFNLNLAFLDPGDVALAADPGYPVYTGGPLLAGADAVLMPLVPELGFVPDLDAIAPADSARAKLLFVNYPNNPTGARRPRRVLRAGRRVRARARDPDRARQRLLGDRLRRLRRALVPRDPRREGGRRRGLLALQGLQHDRLALRGDRRQRAGDRVATGV